MTTLTERQMREKIDELLTAWNARDIAALTAHFTEDMLWSDPGTPEPLMGRKAIAAHLADWFTMLPDFHLDEEEFQVFTDAKNSRAITTWCSTGTNKGGSKETGMPASGKHVTLRGATRVHFREDKVCEYEFHFDMLGFLQQVGALPRTDAFGFKALMAADIAVTRAAERVRETLRR
jgi:steroid delta-isomerase-like uncharacterized protein